MNCVSSKYMIINTKAGEQIVNDIFRNVSVVLDSNDILEYVIIGEQNAKANNGVHHSFKGQTIDHETSEK